MPNQIEQLSINSVSYIERMARKHVPEAIHALVHVATEGASENARVSAAVAILDRAYGKAKTQAEIKVVDEFETMGDAELDEWLSAYAGAMPEEAVKMLPPAVKAKRKAKPKTASRAKLAAIPFEVMLQAVDDDGSEE